MKADEGLLHHTGFYGKQKELAQKLFSPAPVARPSGSNADEWHLFLSEHRGALPFLAVQIAEAIEEAERRGAPRPAKSVVPCYRGGHSCSWPACPPDCDGRPGAR